MAERADSPGGPDGRQNGSGQPPDRNGNGHNPKVSSPLAGNGRTGDDITPLPSKSKQTRRRSHTSGDKPKNQGAVAEQRRAGSAFALMQRTVRTMSLAGMLKKIQRPYQAPPFASFVSRQLHQYLTSVDVDDVEVATGNTKPGAVLFSDASGFTALTEQLAASPDGAERLSTVINDFFTKLIDIVETFGGDIVKFSGDALSIVWAVGNDAGAQDLTTAIARATACSIAVHTELAGYVAIEDEDPDKRVTLSLHMGIGCGQLTAVHVGGVFKRWEYILSGPPMKQIAIAEPLALPGETVLSPEAYEKVSHLVRGTKIGQLLQEEHAQGNFKRTTDHVSEGENIDDFVRVEDVEEVEMPNDPRSLPLTENIAELMKRYIPAAVLPRLTAGQDGHLAELRTVSVLFVMVNGVELEADESGNCEEAIKLGQALMLEIQRTIYQHEGSVNKLQVDDKGLLVLCALGLPPVPHPDDAIRATHVALDLVTNLKALDLGVSACVGVSTGKAFCGVVGSNRRREYTLMGDIVNLSARLMGTAARVAKEENIQGGYVLVDEATVLGCLTEQNLSFNLKARYKMKGKEALIPAFIPKRTHAVVQAPPVADPEDIDPQGRESEIEQIEKLVVRLKANKGGTIVLTGDRGSGKTAVVSMISHKIGLEKGFTVLKKPDSKTPKNIFDQSGPWFSAWNSIFNALLKRASEDAGISARDWVVETLTEALGREPTDMELAQIGLGIPEFKSEFPAPDNLKKTPVAIRELLGNLVHLVRKFAHARDVLIVLHLKTGTAAVTAVDQESWQLAEALCLNIEARQEQLTPEDEGKALVLCVVTRPVSHSATAQIVNIKQVAEKKSAFLRPLPLNEFQRLNFAASALSKQAGVVVSASAMPPDLLQALSDRAAGNPKHIVEMLSAFKSHLRVQDNGRVQILCDDLMKVPVPQKMRGAIKQEIDKLQSTFGLILKSACQFRSFTPRMVYDAMQSRGHDVSEQKIAKDIEDLVALQVLEKLHAHSAAVTQYFPQDWSTRSTYQFVSKLMQEEVRELIPYEWKKEVAKFHRARLETVIRAVVRIQAALRGVLSRKMFGTPAEIQAARLLQRSYRKYRRRRASDTHVQAIEGNSSHSSANSSFNQPASPAREFHAVSPTKDGKITTTHVQRGVGRVLPRTPKESYV